MGGVRRLFEAGRLITFTAFRMGAYSRKALIRGWALIRINTVLNLKKRIPLSYRAPRRTFTAKKLLCIKFDHHNPLQSKF